MAELSDKAHAELLMFYKNAVDDFRRAVFLISLSTLRLSFGRQ